MFTYRSQLREAQKDQLMMGTTGVLHLIGTVDMFIVFLFYTLDVPSIGSDDIFSF